MSFSAEDSQHMGRALKLAARGCYSARPNPLVGCVLVREGEVLAEAFHVRTGEAHAEIAALEAAGDARGATAYVTLEPCAHQGRTGPCVEALIAAGVARVVVAMTDPNPVVSGRGLARLAAAGITIATGLCAAQARSLNRGFVKRMTSGRPLVRVKIAAGIDGGTAMACGESQWITGREARADVQRLRAAAGAVLTGIGTVLADDPRLDVRDATLPIPDQPLRIVLDGDLHTPAGAALLHPPGCVRIYHCGDKVRGDLKDAGATLVSVAGRRGRVDLPAVLDDLGRLEVNEVLVEAGAVLAGAFAVQDLIDEYVIYQAPLLLGSETRPMLKTPAWRRLSQGTALEITDCRRLGRDARITARPPRKTEY